MEEESVGRKPLMLQALAALQRTSTPAASVLPALADPPPTLLP